MVEIPKIPRPRIGVDAESWSKLSNADLAVAGDKVAIAEAADIPRPSPTIIRENENSAQRHAPPREDQTQPRIDIRDFVYQAKLQSKKLLMVQEANTKAFLAFQGSGAMPDAGEGERQQAAESEVFRQNKTKRRRWWRVLWERWARGISSLLIERKRPKK